MGWMRFIHYSFAYLFTVSLIARFIWGFIGNKHSRWWPEFMPWATSKGRKNIARTFTYYTFVSPKVPDAVGHNALAAMAYSGIFVLFLLQALSGFALYAQFAPEGTMYAFFGWLNPLLGNQLLRLTHHIIMWLLIGFAIHHVYSAWLMDIKEKNGTLSSIFGGYKFIEPEDH
jgi:Ni/Fe-hydrogenase 1 B-type cytochrome subunit